MNSTKIVSLILIIAFLFFNCSKKSINPVDETPSSNKESATIGPEGGTVENEDGRVTVPAGTFNSQQNLSLVAENRYDAFGASALSKQYRLTGLPGYFSKPLEISLKAIAEPGDSLFIAVGYAVYDQTDKDTLLFYDLVPASDSSGYIQAEWQPDEQSSLAKSLAGMGLEENDIDIFIQSVNEYGYWFGRNVMLEFPVVLTNKIHKMGLELENVYEMVFDSLGFSDKRSALMKGFVMIHDDPAQVYVTPKQIHVNVSWDHLAGLFYKEIGTFAAARIFAGEMKLAIEENSNTSLKLNHLYWLHDAALVWSDDVFPDLVQISQPFTYYAMAPFNGMQAGAFPDIEATTRHGIGMSSVLKYLVNKPEFGKKGIGRSFQKIADQHNAASALLNSVDLAPVDWWPDFFKEYVGGNINDLSLDFFRNNVSATWDILSDADTLKVFASSDASVGSYPDFSAKMFTINVDHPEMSSNDAMLFSMDAGFETAAVSLVVFGIQNNEPVWLGTAQDQDFYIPKLKSYYDQGMREFLVVLVNSLGDGDLTGSSEIDLTVKMKYEQPPLEFTRCLVSIGVMAELVTDDNGSVSKSTEMLIIGSKNAAGGFDGNTFTGSYDENGFTGTINVTLSDDRKTVASVEWVSLEKDEKWDIHVDKGFTAENIPVKEGSGNEYTIINSSICDVVNSVTYMHRIRNVTTHIESFDCSSSQNSIYVGFY